MKINTITCHRAHNYGAVLQTYALYKHLENSGHDVRVIDYLPDYLKKSQNRHGKSFLFRALRSIIKFPDFFKGDRVFGAFVKNYIKTTPKVYTSCKQLENLPTADAYITGSDQVWNCNLPNGNDDSYFLSFAKNGKKLSYAASIAMDSLTCDQKERFKTLLSDYCAVSVRENTGVKLLDDAGISNVKNVIDPVFLLDKDEWKKISSNKKCKDDYILVYAFYKQKEIFDYARKLANSMGCKVYFINTVWTDCTLDYDKYLWQTSPNNFINMVENAKAIVTNSFHGLSFSLIFNKNVHIFYPMHTNANSRISDIVNLLGIDHCVVKDKNNVIEAKIDYNVATPIINEQIEFSKKYLDDALRKETNS